MDKKETAQILFREGYSQRKIADALDVSTNTVSKWATAGKWRAINKSNDVLKNNSTQRILKIIDYQTQALERRVDAWINEDANTTKLIERGDIDALQKLYTTIRTDAKKFSDYVQIVRELIIYIQEKNLELAQQLTEPADEFINEKQKLL